MSVLEPKCLHVGARIRSTSGHWEYDKCADCGETLRTIARTDICSECGDWYGEHKPQCTQWPPSKTAPAGNAVYSPKHYTSHPSGIECITIAEHFPFNVGNAVKYCWRAGLKTEEKVEDYEKAIFYLKREISRIRKCQ